jgi:ABC-type bacteriocin/lantibiotic exporter with double-glycine peptidase domain
VILKTKIIALYRDKGNRMKLKGKYLTFFKTYIRPHFKYIIILLVLSVISVLFGAITPLLMRSLIDNVIIGRETGLFINLIILLSIIFFSSSIALYFSTYLTGKLSAKVTNNIRAGVFNRLQYKTLNGIYQIKSGDVLSRFMNDVYACQRMFTTYIIQFFSRILGIALPLTIMLILRWDLALICISSTVAYVPISLFFGKSLKVRQKAVLETTGRVSSFLKEALSIFPLTKTFRLEDYQQKRFDENLDGYYSSVVSTSKTSASYVSIATFLIFLPIVLLFSIGGNMVINEPVCRLI